MGGMSRNRKEKAYDEEIAPLVDQIRKVAKKHALQYLIHFEMGRVDDQTISCTTMHINPLISTRSLFAAGQIIHQAIGSPNEGEEKDA